MPDTAYTPRQINQEILHRLLQVSTTLSSTLELQKVLGLVIDVARELTNTEDASILLWDEERGQLNFVAATGEIPLENVSVPVESSVAGWIVERGESVIINDAQDDPRHYGGVDEAYHFTTRHLIGVPLISRDRVIGALEVLNKQGDAPYNVRDLAVLQALASQAAVAIENARLFERFYRVPDTEKASAGSGLGLAIAHKIVEAHGGRLQVESVPGEGTTFVAWLPLAGPDAEDADKAFYLSLEQRLGEAAVDRAG